MQSKILRIIDQATEQTKPVRVKTKLLLRGDVKSIVYRRGGGGGEGYGLCAANLFACNLSFRVIIFHWRGIVLYCKFIPSRAKYVVNNVIY